MDINAEIAKLSQQYDCFYLYLEDGILEQMHRLKASFPDVSFLYSVKCNPNRHILKTVFDGGFGADAASAEEVFFAAECGCAKEKIFYSAPGKSESDLESAIDSSILIADSLNEIERIRRIAKRRRAAAKIGLRIHPFFPFGQDTCAPSKFGIDEDQALRYLRGRDGSDIQIAGIHIHLRSQELDASRLEQYYARIMKLADRLQEECGIHLEYINMGSGIGIPYGKNDVGLDVEALGAKTQEHIGRFRQKYPDTKFMIETGRYLVGQNGLYVTKVLDRKLSCGKTYLIVKNTLNGFLRPSLAKLIAGYAGGAPLPGSEPLFTKADAFPIHTLKESGITEKVTVAGNLCTATDIIAEDIELPLLDWGDVLILPNAGAYGSVLSPMQFSFQERPAELFLSQNGEVKVG